MKRSRSIEQLDKADKITKNDHSEESDLINNPHEINEPLTDDEDIENSDDEEDITIDRVNTTYSELTQLNFDSNVDHRETLKNRYIQEFEQVYTREQSKGLTNNIQLIKLILNFTKLIQFKDYAIELKSKLDHFKWIELSLDLVLWSIDLKAHHNLKGVSNDPAPNENDDDDEEDEDNVKTLTLPKPLRTEFDRIEEAIHTQLKDINYENAINACEGFEEFLMELDTAGTSHFTKYYPNVRINLTKLYIDQFFNPLIELKTDKNTLKFQFIQIGFNLIQHNFQLMGEQLSHFKTICEVCIDQLKQLASQQSESGSESGSESDESVDKDQLALWYEQLGHFYLLDINFIESNHNETEEEIETKILLNFVESGKQFEKSLQYKFNPKLLQFIEQ